MSRLGAISLGGDGTGTTNGFKSVCAPAKSGHPAPDGGIKVPPPPRIRHMSL